MWLYHCLHLSSAYYSLYFEFRKICPHGNSHGLLPFYSTVITVLRA